MKRKRLFCRMIGLWLSHTLGCAATAPLPQKETLSVSKTSSAHEHHAIDYVELTVVDLQAAKRFYGTAFGWQFNDYGLEYAGIQGDGREVGGLRQGADGKAGGPLLILYSADLEDTLDRVRRAGGRIVKETFPFPGGRRFHFADPSGNELAVWSDR